MLKVLRDIGEVLLKEISGTQYLFKEATPPPKGAAGDRTYPVDKKAEEIILRGLEKSGEPLSIISEEAGVLELKGGGKQVIIDPVDGSKNAISGIPFYCTSIAVARGDRIKDIELAYVINLVNGEEFWAEKTQGAFLNGKPVCTQKDDVLYLIAYEAQNPGRDIQRILKLLSKSRKVRCLGATALDLAYLSAGSVSVFVTPSPSRSFDFAGGWLLVKEAGSIITDIDGNELGEIKLGLKRASSVLASGNRRLQDRALRLLEQSD